jgi:hypothetical protein
MENEMGFGMALKAPGKKKKTTKFIKERTLIFFGRTHFKPEKLMDFQNRP